MSVMTEAQRQRASRDQTGESGWSQEVRFLAKRCAQLEAQNTYQAEQLRNEVVANRQTEAALRVRLEAAEHALVAMTKLKEREMKIPPVSKSTLVEMVDAGLKIIESMELFCRLAGHLTKDMEAGLEAAQKGLEGVKQALEALP